MPDAPESPAEDGPTAVDLAADALQTRYEFVLLFDVKNGNPNGDPDAGNAPRVDPETGRGLVSDVCLKRKIRNFVALAKATADGPPEPGYDIYVKEKSILNDQHRRGYAALGLADAEGEPKKQGKLKEGESPAEERVRRWMCQTFFDVRTFGAVMSTGVNAGQVRGPVQIAFAESVEPIVSLEQSITRMAVTTRAEAAKQGEKQAGQRRTMGRKELIPYALYRAHGYVSPHLAGQTGFSPDDLELLLTALEQMFDHDRSASRGEMGTAGLYVFEHFSKLGDAAARRLFRAIEVEPVSPGEPARSPNGYRVTVKASALPAGVTLHRRVPFENESDAD